MTNITFATTIVAKMLAAKLLDMNVKNMVQLLQQLTPPLVIQFSLKDIL